MAGFPKVVYKSSTGAQGYRTLEVWTVEEQMAARKDGWLEAPPIETAPTRPHVFDIIRTCSLCRSGDDFPYPVPELEWAIKRVELINLPGKPHDLPSQIQHCRRLLARPINKDATAQFRMRMCMITSYVMQEPLKGMDELLLARQLVQGLQAEYKAIGLDVPQAIPRRLKEIQLGIQAELAKMIEDAEAEADRLQDMSRKREAAEARAEKLRSLIKE